MHIRRAHKIKVSIYPKVWARIKEISKGSHKLGIVDITVKAQTHFRHKNSVINLLEKAKAINYAARIWR